MRSVYFLALLAALLTLCDAQSLLYYQYYAGLCPFGQVPYVTPQNQPALCSAISQACPSGYSCQRGSGTSQAASLLTCCAPAGSCSTGGTYYRAANGGIPSCAPSAVSVGNCPAGYTCSSSSTSGQYLCCEQVVTCPNGVASQGTCSQTSPNCVSGLTCTPTATGQYACCQPTTATCPNGAQSQGICSQASLTCVSGLTCTATATGQYACCQVQQTAYCQTGSAPVSGTCTSSGTQCAVGATCQQTSIGTLGCCPQPQQSAYCQTGSAPVGACSAADGSTCAAGATCQQTSIGIPGCCPGGTTTTACCTGGTTTTNCCPGGTTSTSCCPTTGTCPVGYSPQITALGKAQTCSGLGALTCQLFYTCLQSPTSTATFVCCILGTGK